MFCLFVLKVAVELPTELPIQLPIELPIAYRTIPRFIIDMETALDVSCHVVHKWPGVRADALAWVRHRGFRTPAPGP